MDAYGMTIKGNVEVGTDNSYRMGNVGTRFSNIYSVYFTGIATSAQWADLAEKYTCKEQLPIGTVISVSDDAEYEVGKCELDCDPACIGVVSEKPAYLMNSELEGGLITGLVGKVPVLIKGPVVKSDFIVPAIDGCARAGLPGEEQFKIGVSLQTKTEKDCKLVLCIIK
jgi:hypothetical protein